MALLKQRASARDDPDAVKTLEILSETHRRKSKMLCLRQNTEGGLSAVE